MTVDTPNYAVVMSNGDSAEADTVEALLLAVKTLDRDVDGGLLVREVLQHGDYSKVFTFVARTHLLECQTASDLARHAGA